MITQPLTSYQSDLLAATKSGLKAKIFRYNPKVNNIISDFNISMATVDDRVAANWGTTRSIRGYHTREVRTHSNNIPLVTSTLIAPRQQWTPSKNQHGMGMPFLGCKRSQTLSAYQIRRTQFQVFADEKGRFLWLKINAKKHILKSTRDRAYAHVIDK